MANYRTIRNLKPYKEAKIMRVHVNGGYHYYATINGNVRAAYSLSMIKLAIDQELKRKG